MSKYEKDSRYIINDCKIGDNTVIWPFVNLYGCKIGEGCMIGTFVEMQTGVAIGNRVRVQSHTFICSGVTIEDDVFIGHGVMFINDNQPRVTNIDGSERSADDWELRPVVIRRRAAIGSNSTILGGITIGENARVGAGAVVTKDVEPNTIVVGNPARKLRDVGDPV